MWNRSKRSGFIACTLISLLYVLLLLSSNQPPNQDALLDHPVPATKTRTSSSVRSKEDSIEEMFEQAFQRGLKGRSSVIHISTPIETWDTSEVGKHGIDLKMAQQLKARRVWLSKQEKALKTEMEKDPNAITRLKAMGGKFAKRIDFILAILNKKMEAAKEAEMKQKRVASLKKSSLHRLKHAKWERELRKLDDIIVNSGGSYDTLRKGEGFSSDASLQSEAKYENALRSAFGAKPVFPS